MLQILHYNHEFNLVVGGFFNVLQHLFLFFSSVATICKSLFQDVARTTSVIYNLSFERKKCSCFNTQKNEKLSV